GYKGQVTFFSLEVYESLCAELQVRDRGPGVFRRNLIVSGADLNALIGQEFTVQGVRFLGTAECSPCHWMDEAFHAGTEASLKDRRILGSEGFISVHVVVDSATGKVVGGPVVSARGFVEDDAAFSDVLPLITAALEEAGGRGVGDAHQLQQVVRRTVGRWVSKTHRRKPMIIPVVIEV
ncbi:MAG: MOSC domain-containing protein, partial [Actinomycetes bacterium]